MPSTPSYPLTQTSETPTAQAPRPGSAITSGDWEMAAKSGADALVGITGGWPAGHPGVPTSASAWAGEGLARIRTDRNTRVQRGLSALYSLSEPN